MSSSVMTTTPSQTAPPRTPLVVRVLLGVVAAALVGAALVLPLWQARLNAPQYPGGLELIAYGDRVEGDVTEIDNLNHYVGMRPFDPGDIPEMGLWPLALAVAGVAVIVSVVADRRWPGRIARLYLWLLPVGVLAAIQFRLHQYGHELDPMAALRIPEFTPLVIGPTKVWNFTTWSRPGVGLIGLVLAAALLSFGPGLLRRVRRTSATTTGAVALAVGVIALGVGAHPAHAQGTDGLAARVAAAAPGDVVVVPAGMHFGDLVIDVPITLRGEGNPMIMGSGQGTTLTVRAPGTRIEGIHVHGSGPGPTGSPAGILIEADDVTVTDTTVEDAYHGIAVQGARNVRLISNHVAGRAGAALTDDGHAVASDDDAVGHGEHGGGIAFDRGDGISIWDSAGVTVRGNTVSHVRDGIYISFGQDVLVDANDVRASRYGIHAMYPRDLVVVENVLADNFSGAVLMYGGPVLALRNEITANRSVSTGFGILLKDVVAARAEQNLVAYNRVGIHLDGPTGSTDDGSHLHANTITRNDIGVALFATANAVFAANSLADNHVQVLSRGGTPRNVAWNDHGFGNYWSNYRGYEHIAGKGATPHLEGAATDRLLTRAPVLTAIATSPGFRLLEAVEQRWLRTDPVLTDIMPLTQPAVPAPALPPPSPATAGITMGLGLSLLSGAVLTLFRLRRPRPRRVVRLPEVAHANA
jgi:parallel beta-helix repeat protein